MQPSLKKIHLGGRCGSILQCLWVTRGARNACKISHRGFRAHDQVFSNPHNPAFGAYAEMLLDARINSAASTGVSVSLPVLRIVDAIDGSVTAYGGLRWSGYNDQRVSSSRPSLCWQMLICERSLPFTPTRSVPTSSVNENRDSQSHLLAATAPAPTAH